MSDRDKDIEMLALRHQLLVLQRQVGKPTFTDTDRAVLAGLLHHLPMNKLQHLLLLVRPETLLRWHRDLLKRRHAVTCVPKRRGRPPTIRSIRVLVLRLAHQNTTWGYRRIHGELAALGIKVAASTVWEILKEHSIPPAPERQNLTWADFLRGQADGLLACDFFETRTLTGARLPAAGRERTDAGPERQHYVGFGQQPCGRRGAVHPDCAEGIGMSCYGVTSTVQVTDVVCLWYGTWRTDTVVALSSSATPAR
jgi:transposase